jgi:hypothetical protein
VVGLLCGCGRGESLRSGLIVALGSCVSVRGVRICVRNLFRIFTDLALLVFQNSSLKSLVLCAVVFCSAAVSGKMLGATS